MIERKRHPLLSQLIDHDSQQFVERTREVLALEEEEEEEEAGGRLFSDLTLAMTMWVGSMLLEASQLAAPCTDRISMQNSHGWAHGKSVGDNS